MGADGSISSSSSISRIRGTSITLRRLRQLGRPAAVATQLVVVPTVEVWVAETVTVDVIVFGVTRKRSGPGTFVLASSFDWPEENRTEAKRTKQTRTFIVNGCLTSFRF